MRKEKEVVIFSAEEHDNDWPPNNAAECVRWFNEKLKQIPDELRDNEAYIDIKNNDDGYSSIVIYYYRMETDKEMNVRETKEKKIQESKTKLELKKLAELKAKYE